MIKEINYILNILCICCIPINIINLYQYNKSSQKETYNVILLAGILLFNIVGILVRYM